MDANGGEEFSRSFYGLNQGGESLQSFFFISFFIDYCSNKSIKNKIFTGTSIIFRLFVTYCFLEQRKAYKKFGILSKIENDALVSTVQKYKRSAPSFFNS